MTDDAATFEAHRAVLTGVAYRIVGQVADAEDVVQEAWLRWHASDREDVRDPRAFLVRVTTRLAIDRLRRRNARREDYVGEWPEPVGTQPASGTGPLDAMIAAETISMALLVVLETLSPLERAVFVLRESFGFSHAEIADALGRSEVAVRQLASRARDHVRQRRPRFEPDLDVRREVTERFLAASASGDIERLLGVLAPDVELVADSGGLVRAPLLPVQGADRVARFLAAVAARTEPGQRTEVTTLNGEAAIVAWIDGIPAAAVVLDVAERLVTRVYLVGNPHKLGRIGPPPT